jgi:hypothetical protein
MEGRSAQHDLFGAVSRSDFEGVRDALARGAICSVLTDLRKESVLHLARTAGMVQYLLDRTAYGKFEAAQSVTEDGTITRLDEWGTPPTESANLGHPGAEELLIFLVTTCEGRAIQNLRAAGTPKSLDLPFRWGERRHLEMYQADTFRWSVTDEQVNQAELFDAVARNDIQEVKQKLTGGARVNERTFRNHDWVVQETPLLWHAPWPWWSCCWRKGPIRH